MPRASRSFRPNTRTSLLTSSSKDALEQIGDIIGYSKETKALFPLLSNLPFNPHSGIEKAEATTLVDTIYQNLFGVAPPAGDAALAKLVHGFLEETTTISEVVLAIANTATGANLTAFQNKVAVATDFTTATIAAGLGNPPSTSYLTEAHTVVGATTSDPTTVTTQEAAITTFIQGTPAVTFTLTTGIDSGAAFTTSVDNAAFNAPLGENTVFGTPQNTLNTGDVLTDTGANGVLNATLTETDFGGDTILATIAGVSTYNLTNINTGFGGEEILDGSHLTGVTTINDVGSSNGTFTIVGGNGDALAAAVTTVGISNTTSALLVNETTAALAGSTDALTINADNVGTANPGSTPDFALVAVGDFAANGVESWTVNSAAAAGQTNFLEISPHDGTTASSATSLVVTGAGAIVLGASDDGSFANLTSINATAASGGVTITGEADVQDASAGLLDGNTALTSALFGAGNDSIDLSSFNSDAQFAALTANGGAGVNTLIASDAELIGASATTFANVTNFQIIGDADPSGGTIDWNTMPVGANELQFFAAGGETIINAPTTFTLDAGGFGSGYDPVTVTAAGTATTDTFNLLLGNASGTVGDSQNDGINGLTVNGYGVIDITSDGPAGGVNFLQAIGDPNTFTASPGGGIAVTISGTASLQSNALELNGNGTSITDTDTGYFSMIVNGSPVANSVTNAASIDAHLSGGLWMQGEDSNFNGITGDVIIGSATHANLIAGSLGNDVLTGGTGGDTIITEGGGDTINLGAGTNASFVDLYDGLAGQNGDGAPLGPYVGFAGTITDGTDTAQAGFWGVAPAGPPLLLTTLAGGTGVEGSMSTVANFATGTAANADVINFSVGAWGVGATSNGLVTGGGAVVASGADAVIGTQTAGTTVASAVDLVELTDHTFANAGALAAALEGSEHLILTAFGASANFAPSCGL